MDLIGTPAAISAIQDAQVDAMEVEPLDSNVSDTARIAYGNSSSEGSTATSAFSASAPCPISRRPGRGILLSHLQSMQGNYTDEYISLL